MQLMSTGRKLGILFMALLLGAVTYGAFGASKYKTVSADFISVDNVFPGIRVSVLGVPVGQVTEVTPQGKTVRVTMQVPADMQIPDNAQAFVMSPELVSDFFIDIGPAWKNGDRELGGPIPVERTHSPVRWDKLMKQMDDVLVELGPEGKFGKDGTIGEGLKGTAKQLDGNGSKLRDTIKGLSQVTEVTTDGSEDITKLVGNLDTLVSTLAKNRDSVNSLADGINRGAADLNQEQQAVGTALEQLSGLLVDLSKLVQDHGDKLGVDVSKLAQTAKTLNAKQDSLKDILNNFPVLTQNVQNAIDDKGNLRIRFIPTANVLHDAKTKALCDKMPLPLCGMMGGGK
ncbi:MCE family protein [Pseudonocardiaceae bacterium YIM PH 21723]|nr:MCE family protein [Pseudonocardiaceae bacterium YIM PH 21723]